MAKNPNTTEEVKKTAETKPAKSAAAPTDKAAKAKAPKGDKAEKVVDPTAGEKTPEQAAAATAPKVSKGKKVDSGILYVQSTYNNTKLILTDMKGNSLCWSSSGSLGFKGAKKGTPFAAAKVGETLAIKAAVFGLKEIDVVIRGVGSGRESSVRGFVSKGIIINSIKDVTPVPHNGPRPKKPRRV